MAVFACEICGKAVKTSLSKIHKHVFCSAQCRQEHQRQLFWSRTVPSATDCWEWQAGKSGRGYGAVKMGAALGLRGQQVAHRVAWVLRYGPIPKGLLVLHRCDNRSCVTPKHLFLGTAQDNTRDAIAKGRMVRVVGERNGQAKLTTAQVSELRRKNKQGASGRALAREYGITPQTVSAITTRRKWRHV